MSAGEDKARAIAQRLASDGFVRLGPGAVDWLPSPALGPDWNRFARSWERLGIDRYMADGGRYRRRRHAALAIDGTGLRRKPQQPHFQSRDYNPLNGDVQRWFEPIEPEIIDSALMRRMLLGATDCFAAASKIAAPRAWHVELHQFRIEATAGALGHPTPEGMHRDGVDWVIVLFVDRTNAAEGVTEVRIAGEPGTDRFTLAVSGDAVLIDDHRVLHGVTPIRPIDPDVPAHRDVLVATWSAESPD